MTAATAGRLSRLYVDQSAGANSASSTLALLSSWSIEQTRDRYETTSLGDATKTYQAGLADAKLTASGFVDRDSTAIYTVADGNSRMFYLYVDATSTATQRPVASSGYGYWYGYMNFDVSSEGGVDDVLKVSINGAATTSIYRV
jgi:hypothetical protein